MSRIFVVSEDLESASVHFEAAERTVLRDAGEVIRTRLVEGDERGDTSILFPPAYGDDFTHQVEFDRLVKPELSASHVAALDAFFSVLEADTVNADGLLAFVRATNQMRLVTGKWLDVGPDTTEDDFPIGHLQRDLWRLYGYLSALQHDALDALEELTFFAADQ